MGAHGMIDVSRQDTYAAFFVVVQHHTCRQSVGYILQVAKAACVSGEIGCSRPIVVFGGCNMTEQWKSIKKTNGLYEISSHGRIRRALPGVNATVGQIIKPRANGWGYNSVNLSNGEGRRVQICIHVLVAELFIGPRPAKHVVNHKDGIKTNNRIDNLEYVTPGGNLKHAYATGLRNTKGERHARVKLTEQDVREIRSLYSVQKISIERIAKRYGVASGTIHNITSGRNWGWLK